MTDYIFLTDGTFSWNGALSGIVQCWGAGGGGAGNRDIGTIVSGGGGGGGAFAQSIVFASGLTAIVRVGVGGAGGVSFGSGGDGTSSSFNSDVVAAGGKGSASSVGAAGGSTTSSVGTTKYNGGAGGAGGTNFGGGGGGSSAGTGSAGNGGTASFSSAGGFGGPAPTGGGAGGNGGADATNNAANGQVPGGGGGGAGADSLANIGGSGANGKVIVSIFDVPAIPTTNNIPLFTSGIPANNSGQMPLFGVGGASINNNISLYMNQVCFNVLQPSGDSGLTPSGHVINSNNTTTNLWSYINSDPLSSLTDNSFINIIQSGHNLYPQNIYFAEYNFSTSNYSINRLNISTRNSTTIANSGIDNYPIEVDSLNSFVYFQQNQDFTAYRTDFNDSTINLINNLTTSFNIKKICVSNRNNCFYILGRIPATTQDVILRYDFYGNIPTTIYTLTSLDVGVSMRYNSRDNTLAILYYSTVVSPYLYYIRTVYLDSTGTSSSSSSSSYISNTTYQDFDLDVPNNKLYIASSTSVIEYSGLVVPTSIGTLFTVGGSPNIASINVDNRNRYIYVGYNDSVNNSGIINYYNMSNGSTAGTIYARASTAIQSLALDKNVYKTTLDFELTNPVSTMTGLSESQLVSNADVIINGLEGYDLTCVNAKIITGNKQNLIWRPNGPYSGMFNIGSGNQIKYIGTTNGLISQTFNSRNDWNSAILRLDISSLQDIQLSGNFKLNSASVEIFCSGIYPSATTFNNNVNLFTKASVQSNNSIPLFTIASGVGKITSLYIYGNTTSYGNIPLYLQGTNPINSGISLYLKVTPPNASMNLFLKAIDVVKSSGRIPFYIFSTANSGLYNTRPLFIKTDERRGRPTSLMNVYTAGGGSYGKTGYMNLYLKSNIPSIGNTVNLYIKNSNLPANSSLPLIMFGPQTGTSGWYPLTSNMNLFIQRNEGWKNNISLYINGPRQYNNNMTVYIQGKSPQSGIPLYINGIGTGNNNVSLYSHGF